VTAERMTASSDSVEPLTNLEDLGLESFEACLGSVFRAAGGGDQGVPLELIEATDLGSSEQHDRFSLVFRGPQLTEMQGTWRLSHASLGKFDLFLVAIGKDDTAILYEAVFSRMPKSSAGAV
jgi:hypothetical protein